MSLTNTSETEAAKLFFQNVDMPKIGDATGLRGSTVAGNYHMSLHTSDPGEGGDQTTNEVAYTGYVRVSVARTAGGWAVTDATADNVAAVSFPVSSGGTPPPVTHVGIGSSAGGAGNLTMIGLLNNPLTITSGVTPEFAIGDLDIVFQ